MSRTDPIERESASREKRHWVRLTRCCNNRCVFCHDSEVQDGVLRDTTELEAEIRAGRTQGAERLILSGGEPTLHPRFVDLVRLGRKVGYSWIQVVSNGRRFSYPQFARSVREAGLDEATFSMHGHEARLHDELVAVSGAFDQSIRGMELLQQAGCVVNVDIVLNTKNISHLVDILSYFSARHVREFDLLWLVPFGRAWKNRDWLFVEPALSASWIKKGIRYAKRKGLVVWTNRLPPEILEGAEEFIQDPHKIHDEVNGRRAELDAWLNRGRRLRCREPERCRHCFLAQFCDFAEAVKKDLGDSRSFIQIVFEPADLSRSLPRRASHVRVRCRKMSDAVRFVEQLKEQKKKLSCLVFEIDEPPSERLLDRAKSLSRELVVATSSPQAIRKLRSLHGVSLEVIIHRRSVDARNLRLISGTRLSLASFESYSQLSREGCDPAQVMRRVGNIPIYLDNIPICVRPDNAFSRFYRVIGRNCMTEKNSFDLDALAGWFVREGYRVRSIRCKTCRFSETCRGFPIDYIRRFGFSLCRPIDGSFDNERIDPYPCHP
jgi:MoaA/NifB/PqqE/SkfB family radical SAM enzyme